MGGYLQVLHRKSGIGASKMLCVFDTFVCVLIPITVCLIPRVFDGEKFF